MPTPAELARLTVQEFAQRFRREMIPLSNRFAWFSALPLGEDEVKDYLQEPIAALPPSIVADFPTVAIFLVPYLERANGQGPELVTFENPPEKLQVWAAQFVVDQEAVLVFAIKDRQVADYHYSFYRSVGTLAADRPQSEALIQYSALLREEFRTRTHGEVDEQGWRLKHEVIRRQTDPRRETKLFRSYARQSLIDTLTLYLHGICCDIDVETGPRQLPSRPLRKRLELLHDLFPPPEGYVVFPEELQTP